MSQNLIVNPSFETYKDCPESISNFNGNLVNWSTPTRGTTDYFNACSHIVGVPDNFNGSQPTAFGLGYAGFYMYAPDDYREYMQAKIAQTLIKGKTYTVSFYISLAEVSDYAIKDVGLLFSKAQLHLDIDKNLSKTQMAKIKDNPLQFLEIPKDGFYDENDGWILVSTDMVANGAENYLTIGNFRNNAKTRRRKTKRRESKRISYYYVDMVSLTAVEKDYELDRIHGFDNVLFQFDEFGLLEGAKKELAGVFAFLKRNTLLKIAIIGYTDNIGSDSYNKKLSQKRAKSVADFLIQLGLPKNRIIWEGHGNNDPKNNNETPEQRKLNRRVEFLITKDRIN